MNSATANESGIFANLLEHLKDISPQLSLLGQIVGMTLGLILILWTINRFILKRLKNPDEQAQLRRQAAMLAMTLVCILLAIFFLPIEPKTREQLIGLLALALTAVIALSSTTFVANIMAGFMLRSLRNFRLGDFVHIGHEFGRVTERGMFHTEIQTEDRDLVTLPNLYLIANPVRVIRPSGTIISATVSLGYDIAHQNVKDCLIKAALDAELEDPFVHVTDLGDYAVTYRVAGFLAEVKHLLSVRSRLRKRMLDSLHAAGIEIVSPTFMNQRQLELTQPVMPPPCEGPDCAVRTTADLNEAETPDDLIFDKAEQAVLLDKLRNDREEFGRELETLTKERKSASSTHEKERLERQIGLLEARTETYDRMISYADEEHRTSE